MNNAALKVKDETPKPVIQIKSHQLKPALASAAKNLNKGSSALQRHREFLEEQAHDDLTSIRFERDQTQVKYEALKGTVDQLVLSIQDIAAAPSKAQSGDISNIRTLLKQAYVAMERQQLELKGIRARTQRIERMSMEHDKTNLDVTKLMSEFSGYSKALFVIRKDMSELVEAIEGEEGLRVLREEMADLRDDMALTIKRTDILESNAAKSDRYMRLMAKKIYALEEAMQDNVEETEGISGALNALKEEVTTLNKKFFNYVLDQMRFSRKDKTEEPDYS